MKKVYAFISFVALNRTDSKNSNKNEAKINLEAYQLREWFGEVLKDPIQNHQCVYAEEQVERIQLISETIQAQRAKGIKRTHFEEVEARLLERFGGEVKPMNTDLQVSPRSIQQVVELLMGQN